MIKQKTNFISDEDKETTDDVCENTCRGVWMHVLDK